MDWRLVAAPACFALAVGLTVVITDPWGLFLGYIAYGLAALAVGFVVLGVWWLLQARSAARSRAS